VYYGAAAATWQGSILGRVHGHLTSLMAIWLLAKVPKSWSITPMSRTVHCAKLGTELPGLAYKPFADALGQRIYEHISQAAWQEWIEHSKRIVNEYRLDLTLKKSHDMLKEQCEQFLFGNGATVMPADYVPPSA